MRLALPLHKRHVRVASLAGIAAAGGVALLAGRAGAGVSDNLDAIGASTNSIDQVDLANGTANTIETGYPVAPIDQVSAALAQRPSDPTPGNNSATDTDAVSPAADLAITSTWRRACP